MEDAAERSVITRAFADALEGADHADDRDGRILDAAAELFCRLGIQRCSMNDVARQAGVSRVTVYRRFAGKDQLVEHVVRREFRRYFDQFLLDIAGARTVGDRVVVGFVSSLRTIRENPVIGGLMLAEPDVVVASMAGRDGATLATVSAFVADRLRREQAAGNVAADVNVALVAEMMVRLTTSFLLTPSRLVDLDDDAELEAVARRFLVPMLRTGASG